MNCAASAFASGREPFAAAAIFAFASTPAVSRGLNTRRQAMQGAFADCERLDTPHGNRRANARQRSIGLRSSPPASVNVKLKEPLHR